jgi:hypothetical protein
MSKQINRFSLSHQITIAVGHPSSMASSSKKTLESTPSKNEGDKSWIPDGYVTVAGPDGKNYLVPEFMVPTLHQSFEAYRKKVDLGAHSAAGSVSVFSLNV